MLLEGVGGAQPGCSSADHDNFSFGHGVSLVRSFPERLEPYQAVAVALKHVGGPRLRFLSDVDEYCLWGLVS